MKNTFLVLIAIFALTACSSDDDSTSGIESQLLGKWLFENPNNNPTVNNSFTFNSNGSVTYSYWDGGQGNNYDSETGTFSFQEDVMTMIFSENVTLTFAQKVVFINDNVVEFEPTGVSGENAYEGDYFRDGAGSYESPDGTLKEYNVYFSGYSSSSQQYSLNITYFKDDEDGQVTTQIVNSQTNPDFVQSMNLESVDKIGFSYDVIGYEESIINRVVIKNLETGEIIFDLDDFTIQDNELFMYDISENTYTVE